MSGACGACADSFHKGDVYVVANVTRINSLRQEPCMEQYYSRRIAKEQCDRVRTASFKYALLSAAM